MRHIAMMPGKPPPPKLDSFHKERSKLIDGFAHVEAELVRAIVRSCGKARSDTFATKIKTLRDLPEANIPEELRVQLDRLQALNSLRTDIVHGAMQLLDADDERYAVFSNARFAAEEVQPALRMTHGAMRKIVAELAETARKLSRS